MTHAQDGGERAGARPVDVPPSPTVHDRPPVAAPDVEPAAVPPVKIKRTRVSGIWVAVVIALLVLIFLLIFILQNLETATVYFLGASGSLPLGVAMLFSAIAGGLLVALVGGARVLQLRKQAKKAHKVPD